VKHSLQDERGWPAKGPHGLREAFADSSPSWGSSSSPLLPLLCPSNCFKLCVALSLLVGRPEPEDGAFRLCLFCRAVAPVPLIFNVCRCSHLSFIISELCIFYRCSLALGSFLTLFGVKTRLLPRSNEILDRVGNPPILVTFSLLQCPHAFSLEQ